MSVILFLVNITDILKASQEPLWTKMVVITLTQNKQKTSLMLKSVCF